MHHSATTDVFQGMNNLKPATLITCIEVEDTIMIRISTVNCTLKQYNTDAMKDYNSLA